VTVAQFLTTTKLPIREIAERCGVHKTQVYRWKDGDSEPQGQAAFILNQIAGGKIRYAEKKRRAPKKDAA
jgi:DNA-binding transcriptional regulator YiaG